MISKKDIIKLLFTIVLSSFLIGCSSYQTEYKEVTKIPDTNEIELEKAFEIKLASRQQGYDVNENLMYSTTKENYIYTTDFDGNIIDLLKIEGYDDFGPSHDISVEGQYIAINYCSRIIVLDKNNSKVIYEYIGSKKIYDVIPYGIELYGDMLIFNNSRTDRIYGVDYKNNEVKWEIYESGRPLDLYRWKDWFFYSSSRSNNSLFRFDPIDGKIIEEYKYKDGKFIANNEVSGYIPVYEKNIEDKDFKIWLTQREIYPFIINEAGDIYIDYYQDFYYHGKDGNLQWELRFDDRVERVAEYKSYIFLLFKDKVAMLNLNNKKIQWSIDYPFGDVPFGYAEDDKLFLKAKDGTVTAYDLSVLK